MGQREGWCDANGNMANGLEGGVTHEQPTPSNANGEGGVEGEVVDAEEGGTAEKEDDAEEGGTAQKEDDGIGKEDSTENGDRDDSGYVASEESEGNVKVAEGKGKGTRRKWRGSKKRQRQRKKEGGGEGDAE